MVRDGVGEGMVGGEGPEAVVFGGVGVARVDVDREAAAGELAGEVFEERGRGGVPGMAAAEEDGKFVAEEEVWGGGGGCWVGAGVGVTTGRGARGDAVAGGGGMAVGGHFNAKVHGSVCHAGVGQFSG